ncbi:MAG: hypothetical protein IMZ73_13740, partial [Chloroflexi bacterium]|nr:hypothetical protein [Chloroflexota bacterium]
MQFAPQVILSEPANPDADKRLREFAHRLAKTHEGALVPARDTVVIFHPKKTTLLEYLPSWELVLRNANAIFKAVPAKDLPVSRAGEWMLDNFYFVKQIFRQIEEDLPASYLDLLPKLDGTPLQGHPRPVSRDGTGTASLEPGLPRPVLEPGLPRIFALAREWIGYSQSQIDLTQAAAFVQEYQQVTPLTIGELWALPIMLRIGILELLACAAAELTGMDAPKSLSEIQSKFASPALANETIVANCFLSLRLLAATDWKDFFEQTSRVEQILRDDPAEIYTGMDFDTRNSYRSVIEELARHSNFSEEQVALVAVEFARSVDDKAPGRKAHVGFYLRDAGRATLEASIRYQPGLSVRVRRALLASPTATYLGSITILSVLFVLGLLTYATLSGGSLAQLIIVGVLGFGLALEAAITLVHWNVTHFIKPQSLPRMDFSEGIPSGNRTMVVVPTLLESAGELNHLLQELELYYLSNPDPQLTYALLTDFGDAPTQRMPEDEQLLALAS